MHPKCTIKTDHRKDIYKTVPSLVAITTYVVYVVCEQNILTDEYRRKEQILAKRISFVLLPFNISIAIESYKHSLLRPC